MKKAIKHAAMRFMMKKLANAVSTSDIVTKNKDTGKLMFRGMELADHKARHLIVEADMLLKSDLYKEIHQLISLAAQENVIKNGADQEDLWTSRSLILFLKTYEDILSTVVSAKQSYPNM